MNLLVTYEDIKLTGRNSDAKIITLFFSNILFEHQMKCSFKRLDINLRCILIIFQYILIFSKFSLKKYIYILELFSA